MGKGSKGLCDADSFPDDLYEDDWTAANAIRLLRRRPANLPWMMHVSFPGPHPPFLVTAAARDAVGGRAWPSPADDANNSSTTGGTCAATHEPNTDNERCNYGAEIETLDSLFAQIEAELDAQGQLKNTVICVTSDHGDMLGDHGDSAKSKPWQGSASVPLLCAGPGIAAGRTVDAPVATMDLAGTFLDLASVAPAAGMTTRSLLPLMTSASRAAAPPPRPYVSSGLSSWRMVVAQHADPADAAGGSASFKLICCGGGKGCPNPPSTTPKAKGEYQLLLIRVDSDPFDMNDLARQPQYAPIVAEMLPLLPPPYGAGCANASRA